MARRMLILERNTSLKDLTLDNYFKPLTKDSMCTIFMDLTDTDGDSDVQMVE
jgi:hypothetical protein